MKKKINYLWIDDAPDRIQAAKNIERLLKIKVSFEDVKGKFLSDELSRILTGNQPTLILIDHKLNNVKRGIISHGSTAAEVIREKWPQCPIICVTGVPLEDVEQHQKNIYEDIYEINKLSEHYASIKSIADSYALLRKQRPQKIEDVIKIIEVPSADESRLASIIPDDLKSNLKDKSMFMMISKWVRNTLIMKPGFLYDTLWTATLIGVKEKSFHKVQNIFKQAKYVGIFADKSNQRWWATMTKEILYAKYPNSDSNLPWEIGRNLPLSKRDFSACHACGKDYPETVGYTDEAAKTLVPLHMRCSVSHPRFEKSLYFDDIRMMKAPA